MLLEGTDHHVHFIYHNREIEQARHCGRLKPNAFVRLNRQQSIYGKTFLGILDYGDANGLLTNASFLKNTAKSLAARGIVPIDNGCAGWLGQFEKALVRKLQEIQRERPGLGR
jgi:hypothetical protein